MIELLAYAKVCFDKCTNPFETMHLIKKNVTADECRDLSFKIADIIEEELHTLSAVSGEKYDIRVMLELADKEFAETQS